MQSFVISDYLNVNVEMIRLEFCSKELLHFSARLWVIKTQMHKHMMGGDLCGKQGLCVQSQQLRVTSLKAAASRSLRGGEREGSSCETAAARPAQKKQLQRNISCSHILHLAAKCYHSLDAMASTAPSPVDIIVEHHGRECL